MIQFLRIYILRDRNDENVKGIKINGKEYKLSKYADDTQLFLDGSELSLHSALSILKKYYYMSGLNINLEKKTRAVCTGMIQMMLPVLSSEYFVYHHMQSSAVVRVYGRQP